MSFSRYDYAEKRLAGYSLCWLSVSYCCYYCRCTSLPVYKKFWVAHNINSFLLPFHMLRSTYWLTHWQGKLVGRAKFDLFSSPTLVKCGKNTTWGEPTLGYFRCLIPGIENLLYFDSFDVPRVCFPHERVWVHGCDPGRVSDGSRLALRQTLSSECPSSIFF